MCFNEKVQKYYQTVTGLVVSPIYMKGLHGGMSSVELGIHCCP